MNAVLRLTPSVAALLLAPHVFADELASNANPYASLIERNVFALVPIPTNPPIDPTPIDPPIKITLNGIMNILGKDQALFNTPGKPAKPGQPPAAATQSYMMSVGERQDDIEVKKIDKDAEMVTFENHGVVQELPLEIAKNVPAPAAPGAPGGIPAPVATRMAGNPPTGGPAARFGRAARANKNVMTSEDLANSQAQPANAAFVGVSGNTPNQETEALSPEAQVLMIEKNRLDTQEAVDKGIMPPLPPTALTPVDAKGANGEPLVAPSEPVPPTTKK